MTDSNRKGWYEMNPHCRKRKLKPWRVFVAALLWASLGVAAWSDGEAANGTAINGDVVSAGGNRGEALNETVLNGGVTISGSGTSSAASGISLASGPSFSEDAESGGDGGAGCAPGSPRKATSVYGDVIVLVFFVCCLLSAARRFPAS